MDYINQMPWKLVLDDNELDCALFEIPLGEMNVWCDSADDDDTDPCNHMPFVLGTSDSREPKYCFTHYFRNVDSIADAGNYQIVFDKK